jgi:lysophospholipase L1-like esterase
MPGYAAGLLRRPWLRATVAAGAVAGLVVPLVAFSASGPSTQQDQGSPAWVGAWAASPMSGSGNVFSPNCPAGSGQFSNQTVRNIVYTSVGGDRVRIRLSNAFGTRPLTIGDASVAVAETGAETVPGTMRQLQFNGQTTVTIPVGAEVVSDPVQLTVQPLADLAVSVYVSSMTGPATFHATAIQDSFVTKAGAGDFATSESAADYQTTPVTCWLFADGVDVPGSARVTGSVVAFGDSITDGFQSDINANDRWPNVLARRLDAIGGSTLSVVDEGISGNQVLSDSAFAGVSALNRLTRDVLDQPGAKVVILLEGINDIGFTDLGPPFSPNPPATAQRIEDGYKQIVAAVHAHGMRIYIGTLTPFLTLPVATSGYQDAAGEVIREQVNDWILTQQHVFDGVINFAAATADPTDPQTFNPVYDSGDHLHPNDVGYNVMGDLIPLNLLLGQNQQS